MSSRNIKIAEGGLDRAFGPVSRLNVFDQNGGIETFVLEADTTLTTKNIDVNGTYVAADDDAYGYSSVTVNCSQEADNIAGKKPDGKGYVVEVDEDGNIVETQVPEYIQVTQAPLRITYSNGDRINIQGIEVTAYNDDGSVWGTVPFDEITIDPATAIYDESSDAAWYTSPLDTSPVSQPIAGRMYASVSGAPSFPLREIHADHPMACIENTSVPAETSNYKYYCIIPTDTEASIVGYYTNHLNDGTTQSFDIQANSSYTYDNKTVYYAVNGGNSYFTSGEGFTQVAGGYPDDSIKLREIAWSMLYGERIGSGSMQDITVQWARPADGEVLTATFYIIVHGLGAHE